MISVDITLELEEKVGQIMEQLMEKKYALGILGLGVMGRSLALNFERNGYPGTYATSANQRGLG